MFSGIVEELGQVVSITRRGNNTLLEINAAAVLEGTKAGDSICVNGVCLTVTQKDKDSLFFDAIPETIRTSNLGSLRPSDKVNLERSLKAGDRISGHFVSGHVDCTGIIRKKSVIRGNLSFEIALPAQFLKYCLPKGSIAVDGISLTIAGIKSNTISVYVIPHTLRKTTFGFKGPSGRVNIEFDMLAKMPLPPVAARR